MPHKYVKKILDARIYDLVIETPIDPAPLLSQRLNNNVLLKREDLQPVFSFKLRGAYNKLRQLTDRAARHWCDCRLGGKPCSGSGSGVKKDGG